LAQILEVHATSDLFARALQTPAVQSLARRLERGGVLSCEGVDAAAQPYLAFLLRRLCPSRPLVIVTENLPSQESFQEDLETWLANSSRESSVESRETAPASAHSPSCSRSPEGAERSESHPALDSRPLFYPSWEVLPQENRLPHVDVISDRLATLVSLVGNSKPEARNSKPETRSCPSRVIVTTVTALLERTFAPAALRSRMRVLRRGDELNPLDLAEWLEAQGYEPEAQVTQKGEVALRGGILDVFPLTTFWPVRLEFFGNELESLRFFDPLTQRSREEITTVSLPPGGELGILKTVSGDQGAGPGAGGQESGVERQELGKRLPDPPPLTPDPWHLAPDPSPLAPLLGSLLDYLPRDSIFFMADPERLKNAADEYEQQVPAVNPFSIPWHSWLAQLDDRGMTRLQVTENGDSQFASLDAYRPLAERAPDLQVAEAQRREFFSQIHRWLRQDYEVHVFCNNDGERKRFEEIWADYGLSEGRRARGEGQNPASDFGLRPSPFVLQTHIGLLSRGFVYDDARLVVVTDAEIFGRYKVQRPRRLKSAHAQIARSVLDIDFTDLEEGDLVVHVQHGIGRFLGLQAMPLGSGRTSELETHDSKLGSGEGPECLVLEFAPNEFDQQPPRLYVPVSEAHLVSKYVGAGKVRPPLNRLGGTRWAKAKQQAERAVRDVAAELLSIQAARESQPGFPFAPDAPWQREFESAFLFEETPDQLVAIQQTKSDMERPKPMDRLICGDVGFGKTEVAIRAAFKAVLSGKQVAVLVPTTVLAQQHFNTFRERMADYPVRIELLSRFRTRRQQQRVVADLAAGAVDVVIGTHRLVQADVAFKDLGLVVIDEEQRFGVMHKEKFKMLRRLVDVLTLSATPIPRTLYLALSGARDMSTIQTPPQDRLPVQTIVAAYDERVIRDAIQREINRGGQVFFLHNRVVTIHAMEQKLRTLLPQARIVVGHGQMHSDELEDVMARFINGEADVLLSTTIIESGLDIPNANTIIIDRADRFGLSDLYQLRGRVGRYKHQAYAYLLLPRHARLLSDVRRRIGAIKQFSTLGSGFKIAMRDLEIRGAGNLLGAEQSGHITAVGFELYCQLLKQSVASLKGEKVKPRIEVAVRLDFLETNPAARNEENVKREDVKRIPCSAEETTEREARGPKSEIRSEKPEARNRNSETRNTNHAFLPHAYAPEPHHRIEIYRKLAQATDKPALENLARELRDRFGPLPPSVDLLLQMAELKNLAGELGIHSIEVNEDKLILTRQGDFITLGGKFPRLTKKGAPARLKEIKRFLLAL
jgi:transcription-repair coupling factor (superfamily II helicase)